MAMQEVQCGNGATLRGRRASFHAKGSNGVRVPGTKVPPFLEKWELVG